MNDLDGSGVKHQRWQARLPPSQLMSVRCSDVTAGSDCRRCYWREAWWVSVLTVAFMEMSELKKSINMARVKFALNASSPLKTSTRTHTEAHRLTALYFVHNCWWWPVNLHQGHISMATQEMHTACEQLYVWKEEQHHQKPVWICSFVCFTCTNPNVSSPLCCSCVCMCDGFARSICSPPVSCFKY